MIGITERGDAGRDLSWSSKMNQVDGAILITKNVDNPEFVSEVSKHRNVIVHATITGYGGTLLEPNVSTYEQTIAALSELIKVQPANRVVLRVDPIIPTEKGLERAANVIKLARKTVPTIDRVRFSFMDLYLHVKGRFVGFGLKVPWETKHAPEELQHNAICMLQTFEKQYNLTIESCGEASTTIPHKWKVGCVSYRDYALLGLPHPIVSLSGQRASCLCLGSKKELLTVRGRCPNKCLYCYWR